MYISISDYNLARFFLEFNWHAYFISSPSPLPWNCFVFSESHSSPLMGVGGHKNLGGL